MAFLIGKWHVWVVLAVLLCLSGMCSGLRCLSCIDLQAHSEGTFDDIIPDIAIDPECSSSNILSLTKTETCPPASSCGALTGKFTVLGSTVEGTVRKCVSYKHSGCSGGSVDGSDLSDTVMGSLTSLKSEVCYCNSDLCVAESCGKGYVKLHLWCAAWWIALLMFAGLLFLLGLFCYAVCCYRKRQSPGVILQQQPLATVLWAPKPTATTIITQA